MASPDEPVAKRLGAPSLLGLADDLLADILLRLPTLADVGRAATACRPFRRVIADPSFRRHLRSLHRAPFLGFFHYRKFHPPTAPHPSARYAGALRRAADLSFSFIPLSNAWSRIRDFRDGRALLELMNGEFAVADPVSRRYVLLPAVPVQQRKHLDHPFLVPAGDEEEGTTSFRVICLDVCIEHLIAFVFSSDTGGWQPFPCQDWSACVLASPLSVPDTSLTFRHCARGFIYWILVWTNKCLLLNTCRMEFSFVDAPPDHHLWHNSAIAESGDGRAEMFICVEEEDAGCESFFLYSSSMKSIVGGANPWGTMTRKVKIELPWSYKLVISGSTTSERYLLLTGVKSETRLRGVRLDQRKIEYFSLDLETMQLDTVCMLDFAPQHAKMYTGFPPSLSLASL